MKRCWQFCLAVVAVAAMTNAASAQWNDSTEIGSYQSILARAGYGQVLESTVSGTQVGFSTTQDVPPPPGAAMAGQAPAHTESVVNVVDLDNRQPCGSSTVASCDCSGACGGACGNASGSKRMLLRGRNGGGLSGRSLDRCATGSCGETGYINSSYDGGCNSAVFQSRDRGGMFNRTNGRGCGLAGSLGLSELDLSNLGGSGGNMVASVFGLAMRRDYEDNRRLGYNGGGTDLYSNDVDHGNLSGLGASISKRTCDGKGWEAILWGLDEEDDYSLAGPTYTYLAGLSAVAHPPSGATVADIYNNGDNARLYRDTDIFNLELNLLRNGGQYTTRTGRTGNYELLGGFRLFNFDESLRYVSNSSFGAYPTTIEYSLEAENSLAGIQIGGRNEICLSDQFRFAYSGTAGIFNNHIETRQQIFDNTAYSAMDYSDTKNDAAVLGQIDLALIYQFSAKSRARVGYRAMGAAGVALAADQIPYDFTDTRALTSANSNGSLLMHGLYFGSEFCF